MTRLIELQVDQDLPASLTLAVGDLLWLEASGGEVLSGESSVELLGAFLKCVVGLTGEVLAPMGAPNVVLFRARRAGTARIAVVSGDPWHQPTTIALRLVVIAGAPALAGGN